MKAKIIFIGIIFMMLHMSALGECAGAKASKQTSPSLYRIQIRGEYYTLVSLLAQNDILRLGMPHEAVMGQLIDQEKDISPKNFVQNKSFVQFLHDFLQKNIPRDPRSRQIAKKEGKGFLWVIDERSEDKDINKVPLEDIIGLFVVENGQIIKQSYTPFGSHRLLTDHGFFLLKPDLQKRFIKALKNLPPVKNEG